MAKAKAKIKIPKQVAGVKVPKALRKEAKKALELVESKAVRELALAGLSAAAQKLADRAKQNLDDPGHRRATLSLKGEIDALNLGEVLRGAAIEGARRFLAGFEDAMPVPAAPERPKAPAEPKAARAPAKPKAAAKPRTRRPSAAGSGSAKA
jgi:hypothetical protein